MSKSIVKHKTFSFESPSLADVTNNTVSIDALTTVHLSIATKSMNCNNISSSSSTSKSNRCKRTRAAPSSPSTPSRPFPEGRRPLPASVYF